MIIKSMSRKQPSFEQLYDYIVRDKDNDVRFNFTHNHFGVEREEILNEFIQNAERLSKRKGANYLYHEVISITRSKQLTEEQQKEILRELVQQYIHERARDCLVFAGLHDEKANQLHYHLIISANKVEERKRYFITKKQFDDAKRNLELYTLERYPQLEQAKLISKEKGERKASNKEGEYKRRTGKKTQKEYMQETLRDIFNQARTQQEYIDMLRDKNVESYLRGKTMGFHNLDTNRKHRLTTLGLSEEYDEMQYRFDENTQSKDESANKQEESVKKQDKNQQQDGFDKAREKVGDTLKEWVAGDFSQRDANQQKETKKKAEQDRSGQQGRGETLEEKVIRERKAQAEERYNEKSKTQQKNRGKDKSRKR